MVRLCVGCKERKQMLDGLYLCDECREQILMPPRILVERSRRMVQKGKGSETGASESDKPFLLQKLDSGVAFFGDGEGYKGEKPIKRTDKDDAIIYLYIMSNDINEVCEKTHVSKSLVNVILDRYKVRVWLNDFRTILVHELDGGKTLSEIAEQKGIDEEILQAILAHKKYHVKLPEDMSKLRNQEMSALYLNEHMPVQKIKHIYNCHETSVAKAIRENPNP